LREEFAALGVPFGERGSRLEEWIGLVRDCWTGEPRASSSPRYVLPADVLCLPRPAHRIPVLVGGHSVAARRRAATIGDGWLAQQSAGELDSTALVTREGDVPARVVLRIVDSLHREAEVAARLRELEDAGVDEVVVDVPVDRDSAARALDVLRGGVR
jgi:alkanesulfonate monooxygenase SsuD/methylene tetrahydromethanopterin reductase-like flavin-dependent oxidoreductase (luciferase family)